MTEGRAPAPLPADALASWLAACGTLGTPVEQVQLAEACGRVLATDVAALRDCPAHPAAAMDGLAVSSVATAARRLAPHDYDVVDTGDVLPPGRDAVVMRERVTYDGGVAGLAEAVSAGQHVRQVGEDVRAGEGLLGGGHRLRPVDLAWLAAAGHLQLPVRRRPHVVVIPTGDEVLALGSTPGPGEVLDTNSLMLVALAIEAGCTASATPIVPDDPALLTAAVHAAAELGDLVIVGAGSSAGRDDHTAAVVAAAGRLVVHGVAVRPGHPVVLGVVGATPVLGAPGYPVSTALTWDLFAAPLLAVLTGSPAPRRAQVSVRLAVAVTSPPHVDDWVRVSLTHGLATPLRGGAGSLGSLARADALLLLPAGVAGLPEGAVVEVGLLGVG